MTSDSLESYRYLASYADLMEAFGSDTAKAALHYNTFGQAEGRKITFDPWSYLASNDDLIETFGTDIMAAARHYVQYGYKEGRKITFDTQGYLDSYDDLKETFGNDVNAALQHYINFGHDENRFVRSLPGTPFIESFSPIDKATGIDLSSNIVLVFNESIRRGSGQITLLGTSVSGPDEESFDVATSKNITISGATLTINPTVNLANGTEYFVTFDTGSIMDLTGNGFAGTPAYTFKTLPEKIAPTLISFSPTDGATDVAIESNIVLTFSEMIQKGTGTISIHSGSVAGPVLETFDAAASSNISITGTMLIIDPSADLENNTEYFVTCQAGSVIDLAGNSFAGTSTYDFKTVPDTTAPIVATITPADGSTGIAIESNIVLMFNEIIQKGRGTIAIHSDSVTGPLFEAFDTATSSNITITDRTLIINPSADFANGTEYFVTCEPGLLMDLAGNSFAERSIYSFKTLPETIAPTVIAFSPTDGSTNVAIESNIVLKFSETIQKGTGTIAIHSGSVAGPITETFNVAASNNITISDTTLIIDPSANLANNTTYFVTFETGSVVDLVGNSFAGTSTYDFKTVPDTTAPTVVSFSPSDGSTGVLPDSNIVVTFSEMIQKGRGTIAIHSVSAKGAVIESFSAADNLNLTFSENSLTINPTVVLSNSTQYFVTFQSGTVKDLAGNSFAGTSTYDFKTAPDTTAPTVTSFTPADGSTTVMTSSNIVLTFSETVQKGTGYIAIHSGSADGIIVESFNAANSQNLKFSGKRVTIDPTSSLQGDTHYFVTFDAGSIKDLAGNGFAGISTYDFKTAIDNKPPTVSSFSPADGSRGVATGSNIVLTFDETIQRGTGTITIHSGSINGDVIESFNAAESLKLTFSGNKLTIDPSNILINNTEYFVTFDAGTIKDLSGNSFAGTSNYDFKTVAFSSSSWDVWSGYGLLNIDSMLEEATGKTINDAPLYGDGLETIDWGVNKIQAPDAWNAGYTGNGVIVAVIDSGVNYLHSDLSSNIWHNTLEIAANGKDDDGNGYIDDIYGYDFINNDGYAFDDNGHGTHVAGIIAGLRNDVGVTGIAYNAQIMPIKVLSSTGSGNYEDVAEGIYYAVYNHADVINLSLGGGYSSKIVNAIRFAVNNGIIICMASGNSGQSQPIYPAILAQTIGGIAVGAIDSGGAKTSFSNGTGSDELYDFVVAPGMNIYSTYLENSYKVISGTSMATPYVSGAAALLLSASNDFSSNWALEELENLITTSASALSEPGYLSLTALSGSNYSENQYLIIDDIMNSIEEINTQFDPVGLTGIECTTMIEPGLCC